MTAIIVILHLQDYSQCGGYKIQLKVYDHRQHCVFAEQALTTGHNFLRKLIFRITEYVNKQNFRICDDINLLQRGIGVKKSFRSYSFENDVRPSVSMASTVDRLPLP